MFRAHVLIIRRPKLHYTASGIITPIVKQILCIKLVKYWDNYTEMHGQQNVKIWQSVYIWGQRFGIRVQPEVKRYGRFICNILKERFWNITHYNWISDRATNRGLFELSSDIYCLNWPIIQKLTGVPNKFWGCENLRHVILYYFQNSRCKEISVITLLWCCQPF